MIDHVLPLGIFIAFWALVLAHDSLRVHRASDAAVFRLNPLLPFIKTSRSARITLGLSAGLVFVQVLVYAVARYA